MRGSLKKRINQAKKLKTPTSTRKKPTTSLNWNDLEFEGNFQDAFKGPLTNAELRGDLDNQIDESTVSWDEIDTRNSIKKGTILKSERKKIPDFKTSRFLPKLNPIQKGKINIKEINTDKFQLFQKEEEPIRSNPKDKIKFDTGGFSINPICIFNNDNGLNITELPQIIDKIIVNESPIVKLRKSTKKAQIPINEFAPDITDQSHIKGIFRNLSSIGKGVKQGNFYSKFFYGHFYPPQHFRGYYRKSKVALQIHCTGYQVNNPNIKIPKNETYKSFIPSDYASFRSKWRRMIRSEFLKIYKKFGSSIDGFYVFRVQLYPKTDEEMTIFKTDLEKYLIMIKNQNFQEIIKKINSQINWNGVIPLLKENKIGPHAPPPFIKSPTFKSKESSWNIIKSVLDVIETKKKH